MSIRIFSVDPGHTIGYAVLESPTNLLLADQTHDEAVVFDAIREYQPSEVVIERYRPYPGMVRMLGFRAVAPAELVERIKRFCDEEGVPVVEQSSAQISDRGLFSGMLLRQLGLWQRGKPHANDAIRHALYRLWFGHGYSRDGDVADWLREMLQEAVSPDA